MKINLNKHIYEGWTVGDFIENLAWQVELIMSGGAIQKPFDNKQELADWCKDNQPYYKKKISDVNNYFTQKYNLQ